MADQEMQHAGLPAPALEQPITRLPCCRLHAARAMAVFAHEDPVGDAALGEPLADLGRLSGSEFTQAVVDGERGQIAAPRFSPIPGKQRQRHAVGAAGDRHSQSRPRLERLETRHQRGEFNSADRRRLAHWRVGNDAQG
jgi:hypothetical protein